jgi:hypothetical protein
MEEKAGSKKKGRDVVVFSNSYLCQGIEASLSGVGVGASERVMAWSPPHGNSTASSCKPNNGEAFAELPGMVGGKETRSRLNGGWGAPSRRPPRLRTRTTNHLLNYGDD